MSSQAPNVSSRRLLWAGRVISALPVLMLLMSAVMKLMHAPEMVKGFVDTYGYRESAITPLAIVELACVVLYAIPQTSVFGAVLATGYLGGAVATHVRIGDPFWGPLVLGVLIWAGLFLRDERVRALLPLRKLPTSA